MNLTTLKKRKAWERRIATLRKSVLQRIRPNCSSKPVFVLGKQRSGTSMLMFIFHRHSDTLVFDEHKNNAAFENFRLRDIGCILKIVENARFHTVCFKPISDSHLIELLHEAFPDGQFVWLYRDFKDTANSSLRKFTEATRAIKLVCRGEPGGGWFAEGISPQIADTLRDVYRADLPEFDLACLVWWARNQIILQSGLIGRPNITLLKYEALAVDPRRMLAWLCHRIDVEYMDSIGRKVSARSIGRHAAPGIDHDVERLCTETAEKLDDAFYAGNPPSKRFILRPRAGSQ